jgi:hypothetical protein
MDAINNESQLRERNKPSGRPSKTRRSPTLMIAAVSGSDVGCLGLAAPYDKKHHYLLLKRYFLTSFLRESANAPQLLAGDHGEPPISGPLLGLGRLNAPISASRCLDMHPRFEVGSLEVRARAATLRP